MMIRKFVLAAFLSALLGTNAQVVFHNESDDTTRINNILIDVVGRHLSTPGDAVVAFAESFLGTPYVAGTLEGDTEELRVNIDEVDCTTFADQMIALALTADENRSSWRDFVYNLQKIRYRDGKIDGYPSRLHYVADWAVDNVHRGILTDVTDRFPKCNYMVKTIDFMSANRDKYPALADSANFARMKRVEIGYRRYRFPYLKTGDISNSYVKDEFKNGDIVAFTSALPNLDVAHMGVIVIKDGEPHVIHASSSAGKVVMSELPIDKFLKKNRTFTGVRVFRLNRQ